MARAFVRFLPIAFLLLAKAAFPEPVTYRFETAAPILIDPLLSGLTSVTGTFTYDNGVAATVESAVPGQGIVGSTIYQSVSDLAASADGNDFSDSAGIVMVGDEKLVINVAGDTADFVLVAWESAFDGAPLNGFSYAGMPLTNVWLSWREGLDGIDDFLDDQLLPSALPPTTAGRLALGFTDGDSVSHLAIFAVSVTSHMPDDSYLSFTGEITFIGVDKGDQTYSGVSLGDVFHGEMNLLSSNGYISDGALVTEFGCCLSEPPGLLITNDEVLIAEDAEIINDITGTSFSAGDTIDSIGIEGSVNTANGPFVVGLYFVVDSSAFENESRDNYPPDPSDVLASAFYIVEEQAPSLTISFDTFDNLYPDSIGIDVIVTDELVGRSLVDPFTDGVSVPVSVNLDADGTLDLTFDGVAIFTDLPTGFVSKSGDVFGFGGRTGAGIGGQDIQRIDNVSISVCADPQGCASPDAQYVNDFSADVGSANLLGTAVLDGGSVRLTENVNEQMGSLLIEDLLPGQKTASFSATFDLQTGPGPLPHADGVSFYFGPQPDEPFGEEGTDGVDGFVAAGVINSTGPRPLHLLMRRMSDSRWFSYSLAGHGDVEIVDKGSAALPRNLAYETMSRADFDGNGIGDILLRDTEGSANGRWLLGTLVGSSVTNLGLVDLARNPVWDFVAAGDFGGDSGAGVLLRNTVDGRWQMSTFENQVVVSKRLMPMTADLTDAFIGTGDFDGDGDLDILMRRADGSWLMYLMDGENDPVEAVPAMTANLDFTVQALDDFDGNGTTDVLLRRANGRWYLYALDGSTVLAGGSPAMTESPDFALLSTADFNGDGKADALLRRGDGRWFLYTLDGDQIVSSGLLGMTQNTAFELIAAQDVDGDGMADLLLRRNTDGRWVLYRIDGSGPAVLGVQPLDMARNLDWAPQVE